MDALQGASVDGVIRCRGRREIDDVTVTGGNGESDFLPLNENYYLFLATGPDSGDGEAATARQLHNAQFSAR